MIKHYKVPAGILLIILLLVVSGVVSVSGQCVPQVRRYATRQHDFSVALLGGLGGSVTNENRVIDGNPFNSSSLNFAVGAAGLTYAEQVVDFNPNASATTSANSPKYPAGKPITVKLTLPKGLVGVGTGIEIQAIKGLANVGGLTGWTYTPVGATYSGASLLSLLSGAGDVEVTIIPTAEYEGVRVRLTSALGIAATAGFFHAYVLEAGPTNNTCNQSIDVLAGVRAGGLADIATATGTVVNQYAAIDADLNSFAEINVGAQLASEVFHTTIFKTLAQPGDAVQMIIQKPGGGLLDLNLLNSFSLRMYNGSTPIGSAFNANSGLSLALLPGSTDGNEKYTLTIQVPKSAGAFDRVELKMGGVLTLGLTPGIRIYDVKHIVLPKFAIDGLNVPSTTLCFGNTSALSVSEIQDCTTYKWFSSASGGTLLQTGTTYTPIASGLVVGANTFYLEATRTNCTDVISRVPVTINILPLPTASIAGTASVCQSAPVPNVVFTGANGTAPYQFSYTINSGAIKTITTISGNSVSLPVPNALPGPYIYTLVSVKDNSVNQCTQAQTGSATVTVTAKPQPPSLTINVNN
jgi:hypothetical protein